MRKNAAMNHSKATLGWSKAFRICALALVRIWAVALLLTITALLLTGCKSGNELGEPAADPPAPVANIPPVANAGTDQLVLTGAAVGLAGSGSDADGSIAT